MSARTQRALLIGLCAGLAFFLFLQPGNPYDEAEHLHAAWLIAVRGMHPVRDFFEHHPPLFWHILAVPFRLGVRGPEVLYAARLLVLLCAAIWGVALFALARRWSKEPTLMTGAFALALFALTVLLEEPLFVARPETLATALFGLALILWLRSSLAAAAAAGVLVSLAVCASPRFALLAPMLLWTPASGRLELAWPRLGAALLGAAAALVAFFRLVCPLPELFFDLRFSQLLQHQGLPPAIFSLLSLSSCVLAEALVIGMLASGRTLPRRSTTLWVAHGALVWLVLAVGAGRFPYAQAFAPALIWATLFAAWLEAQPLAQPAAAAQPALRLTLLCGSLAAVALQTVAASLNSFNVIDVTASRRLLVDALPAGAHVFIMPESHPITMDDASYWGAAFSISICDTTEEFPRRYPDSPVHLPTCDFAADLRRVRPEAVSRNLFMAGPALQIENLRSEIAAHYHLTDVLDDAPVRSFSANILFRNR